MGKTLNQSLGKRIVELQTSLALLSAPQEGGASSAHLADEHGRIPFEHAAYTGLENLTDAARSQAVDKQRLSRLAHRYGMGSVMRWKPKKVRSFPSTNESEVVCRADTFHLY